MTLRYCGSLTRSLDGWHIQLRTPTYPEGLDYVTTFEIVQHYRGRLWRLITGKYS